MPLIPPRLMIGDTIGVVTPSAPISGSSGERVGAINTVFVFPFLQYPPTNRITPGNGEHLEHRPAEMLISPPKNCSNLA
ncbi:MAG: hypothetical protein JJE12_09140 [Anaerolineales bacterium]|nr:hypothetical protein [Anaerolineales bacterium]